MTCVQIHPFPNKDGDKTTNLYYLDMNIKIKFYLKTKNKINKVELV